MVSIGAQIEKADTRYESLLSPRTATKHIFGIYSASPEIRRDRLDGFNAGEFFRYLVGGIAVDDLRETIKPLGCGLNEKLSKRPEPIIGQDWEEKRYSGRWLFAAALESNLTRIGALPVRRTWGTIALRSADT